MMTLFTRILSELDVPHTKSFSESLYKEHPYCYTLYGLEQMLSRYNIKTVVSKLSNKGDMANVETPFLAEAYNDIVLVKRIAKDGIFTYDWYGQDMKSTSGDFEKDSTGVVMQMFPDLSSKEPNYKIHKRDINIEKAECWCLVLLPLVLFVFAFHNVPVNPIFVSFTLTGIVGAALSCLIICKTLNNDSVFADKICQISKASTCNDILQSKAAKLFNRYGWGEIGLGYFAMSAILSLVKPGLTNAISFYSVAGMLFPIWSLWYQKFKAKMWCPLCLCVLWVLIVQGFIGCSCLANSAVRIDIATARDAGKVGVIYAIAVLAICKVVNLLQCRNDAAQTKHELSQIKYKPQIVNTLLNSGKSYDCSENASHIIFGNKDSNYQLTVFSNPYCQPCAEMHKHLQRLLVAGCRIQYVFNYFSADFSNVNKLLIAAYYKYGAQKAWNVFSDWYAGGKDKQTEFFCNDIDANNPLVAEEFEKHERWRKENGFSATPTLLLNGKALPGIYNVHDIAFMIENGLRVVQ